MMNSCALFNINIHSDNNPRFAVHEVENYHSNVPFEINFNHTGCDVERK